MPFQFYTDTSGPQHLVVLIFIYFSISVKESWVLKRIDGWRQVSSWSTNYKIRSPHTYIKSTSIILLFLRSNNFLVPFRRYSQHFVMSLLSWVFISSIVELFSVFVVFSFVLFRGARGDIHIIILFHFRIERNLNKCRKVCRAGYFCAF